RTRVLVAVGVREHPGKRTTEAPLPTIDVAPGTRRHGVDANEVQVETAPGDRFQEARVGLELALDLEVLIRHERRLARTQALPAWKLTRGEIDERLVGTALEWIQQHHLCSSLDRSSVAEVRDDVLGGLVQRYRDEAHPALRIPGRADRGDSRGDLLGGERVEQVRGSSCSGVHRRRVNAR